MKRILVAGGAGFIGSNLCRRLIDDGDAYVICCDNLYTGSRANIEKLSGCDRFEFIEHDITEPLDIDGIDEIYNLACPASPKHYQKSPVYTIKTNVLGIINLLELAVKNKVGNIIVDNIYELETLNETAKKYGIVQNIMFRIKPGVDAHTHSFIQTGQIDSKFGVALENGEAFEIIEKASKMSNVKVNGVHCHIGSQIFDIEPFCKAAEIMMNFVGDLKDKLGLEIDNLNLGGGYGIMYTENDDPVPYDEYIQHVSEVVKATAEKRGVKLPFILMEPGRSIIAPAGITLYTVGGIKDIKNVRKYR